MPWGQSPTSRHGHAAATPGSAQPGAERAAIRTMGLRILPRPGAGGRRERRPAGRPARPARGADVAADPLTGRVLDGRYRIGSRIARGGMASVYEAIDLRLDRTVAVKIMHPGLGDDDEFAARFVREARAAARLSHPNVVAVYDQGDDDGTVFLAMELIPGHTLRDTIGKESPMSPARALALLEPVVSALAAAHRAGLIHRDVKPENVLIADDGRVKVADFGLAKAVSADTQHTATGGVLIGTVSYVAPELVVEGRSDARADVYAVGVILYELLTGHKPHEGETPIQVAYKHVHEDVPPPSGLVPGIPAYVDALVARATARDREQRPADAGVLLHHLRRVNQALTEGVRRRPRADRRPRPRCGCRPTAAEAAVARTTPRADPFDSRADRRRMAPPRPDAHRPSSGMPTRGPASRHAERRLPPGRSRAPGARGADRPAGARAAARERRRRRRLVVRLRPLHHDPRRHRAQPGRRRAAARGRRARRRVGRRGLLRDRARGPRHQHRPRRRRPGARRRQGHGRGLAGQGALRPARRSTGITEDEAQDAGPATNLAFGKAIESWSETVPKGIVIASDPKAGTTLRPGAIVDLVVSKGPQPIPVGLGRQGRRRRRRPGSSSAG